MNEHIEEIIVGSGLCTLLFKYYLDQNLRRKVKNDTENMKDLVIGNNVTGNTNSFDITSDTDYNTVFVKISGIEVTKTLPTYYRSNNYMVPMNDATKSTNIIKLITFNTNNSNFDDTLMLSNDCYGKTIVCKHDAIQKMFKNSESTYVPIPLNNYTSIPYEFYRVQYVPYINKTLRSYEYNNKKLVAENVDQITEQCISNAPFSLLTPVGFAVISLGSFLTAMKSVKRDDPFTFCGCIFLSTMAFGMSSLTFLSE